MPKPLVSLLIPTFNSVKYLALALDSAFAQTYENTEIIVHDDASTDTTPELLAKYRNLAKVRLIRTEKNHGMINGWNYLTNLAKGKYIKFLASDDLLTPNCVEELVEIMEKHPFGVLATCRRQVIDETGTQLSTLGFAKSDQIIAGPSYAHRLLTTLRENQIGEPSAVLYPTELIKKVGGFDPRFSQFADFEYWLRLLEFGKLIYVDKTLCSFRTHAKSNTSQAILDGRFIDEIFALIEKYYSSPHYRKVFSLTTLNEEEAIKTKTLDTLKNTKDLLLTGHFLQARNYFRLLSGHVESNYMTKVALSHFLKKLHMQ